MATNKHAIIRYHALDRCFGNFGRRFCIDDLVEACNDALADFSDSGDAIKKRQVYNDIKFMESDQGWSIELIRERFDKKVYYRYADKSFSIKNQSITDSEISQIKDTLSILSRFKGMPNFSWVEETIIRLETSLGFKGIITPAVGFQENPYLKGLNFFSGLFNAIVNKRVLLVEYQGFRQAEAVKIVLHPYYLKQFNNRWFIFGLSEDYGNISNLALDRIIALTELDQPYIENTTIDFEEYFEDVYGVTVKENQEPKKVLLKINKEIWPYIETKPIHGSQKIKERTDDFVLIELSLQVNFELISHILSFGESIKVISPEALKNEIKTKVKGMHDNYF